MKLFILKWANGDSENLSVRSSENPSIKAARIQVCTYSHTDTHTPITIKCFRTLEIKKRLAAIQGAFIYETRFRLSVKAKLRGALMCPILQELAVRLKSSSLATIWSRSGLELFESPIHRALFPLAHVVVLWKALLARLVSTYPDLKLTQCKEPFFWGHLPKTIRDD